VDQQEAFDRDGEDQHAVQRACGQEAKAPNKRRDHHGAAELDIPAQGLDNLDLIRRPALHAGSRQSIDERPADHGRTKTRPIRPVTRFSQNCSILIPPPPANEETRRREILDAAFFGVFG